MKNTVFNAFLCCFFILTIISGGVYSKEEGVFTVSGVKIDVTADSAAKARNQAFDLAQIKAFDKLVTRLIGDIDDVSYEKPQLSEISTMVKDFEVTKEKISAVRYVGEYSFRFNSKLVKKYFSKIGVEYTDVKSKPILVLPFYQVNNQNILWSGDNPWFDAWRRSDSDKGLVPMLTPIGDISDMADIKDGEALTYRQEKLERIISRYGVKEAVILIAAFVDGGVDNSKANNLTIYVYRTGGKNSEYTNSIKVKREKSEKIDDMMDRAVVETIKFLQKGWKDKTIVNANQGNKLQVRVPFRSIKEWVETKEVLKSVQAIGKIEIVSIKPRVARLNLIFNGSEQRLRLALEQADITLTTPKFQMGLGDDILVYSLYMDKYASNNENRAR